ncbi:zinc finger matrin-type protein 5 [Spodoptera litura]|uniref:Zinc finger matrin-type protein 5 n=1 Tax=Spodoptera litura TaxID=69820 RepID=A0A9J7EI16_SPOLT|nr:zinc finger matrin-type protein 5 [Spodoptera litura]
MGKRYVCDYCNKVMVAAPAIVKTHNKGLVHQRLVQEHYHQFKDIETILVEESKKKPCVRFASGECKFGSICHFSHYTVEQIRAMGEYVASKNRPKDVIFPSFEELVLKLMDEKSNKLQDSTDGTTMMYDKNGITHTFPWTYNSILDNYPDQLPPSIKRLKIEDFTDAKIETWG